jgi:ribosomal protein S18 acetylase RimI-like enzyme
MNSNVVIIPFSETYSDAIKTLNLEWLTKYFKVEPKDEMVLSNPKSEIIDKGGFIFYAQYQGSIVGTVSLLKIDNFTFELSKMAVSSSVQGIGIGKLMLEHCFEFAKNNTISKLILYSNRSLESAIHLYTKYGFKEIPLESGIYERADIKMEKSIL